jgi:hypothetical protein
MRTHTEPRVNVNPDGRTTTTHTVQRVCNGCGHEVGDATDDELAAVIRGLPLPDVRDECPWCAPFLTEEGQR